MTAKKLIGQMLTGAEFNEQFCGPFYKILAENMQHYDFKYREGLNTDHHKFNPTGECSRGGLYFTDESNIAYFVCHGPMLGLVQIPEDASVYIESNKYKADKIIITKIIRLSEFKLWTNKNWCECSINQNAEVLKYVTRPTYKMCNIAVRSSSLMLEFVPRRHKTKSLCEIAVSKNGGILCFVRHKTRNLCKIAVENDGSALRYVPRNKKTKKMCLLAVEQDGLALQYVPKKKRTQKISLAAVEENGLALKYVPVQTREICLAALREDKNAIKYVKKRTQEIVKAASWLVIF